MSSTPSVGDVIAGKYTVERILGQGGMGVVVAARHVDLDERVAIKFILPECAENAEVVARFLREGKLAVKIKSEHVARVSDVGRLESGAPYLVMEYLEGSDLSQLLSQRGPLGVQDAVLYVLQACEALAEAHTLGIVHRDLKPANLFLTTRRDGSPCVKVLDFGIAKLAGGADKGMTRTGGLMGSALYMSPEQLASAKDIDARADIWAIGVILYELLTAKAPFDADELPQLIVKILNMPPEPVSTHRGDIPPDLEALLLTCLSKDRGARFATVAALAGALLPFAPPRADAIVERIARVVEGSAAMQVPSSARIVAPPPVSVRDTSAFAATAAPPSSDAQPRAITAGTFRPLTDSNLQAPQVAAKKSRLGVVIAAVSAALLVVIAGTGVGVSRFVAGRTETRVVAQPPAPPPAIPTIAAATAADTVKAQPSAAPATPPSLSATATPPPPPRVITPTTGAKPKAAPAIAKPPVAQEKPKFDPNDIH